MNTTKSEFVAFQIGDLEYCLDIMAVREIRSWSQVTAIPHSPTHILGMINLRGSVLPILDLAARLGLPPTTPSPRHVNIVVEFEDRLAGLLVDAVSDVLTIDGSEVHTTPSVSTDPEDTLIENVLSIDDRMIQLISIEKLVPKNLPQAA